MTRNNLLSRFPVGLRRAVCIAALLSTVLKADIDRPNVLFIAIDDLNDWIGALGGHPQAKTPNIDRLAKRSVLFANAHCAAPACNPSRAALMTGIAPNESGVYHNPQPWRPALPDAITIPQHFTANGYRSGGSGKIYHSRYPDPASWETYYPHQLENKFGNPSPPKKNLNGLDRGNFDWGPLSEPTSEMGDNKTAKWVAKKLGREHDKPFFLACGIYRPHLPWYVPQEYFDRFPIDSIQLPNTIANDLEDLPAVAVEVAIRGGDHASVVKGKQWKHAVQGYLASIAFADEQVGIVVDALDKSPHKNNTIIVLWTDHGWHLGEKEHWRKFALWHRSTRTPLMFSVPKGVSALPNGTLKGRQSMQPVSLLDVYPTLIELCGLPAKNELSGKSLVPLLRDPDLETGRAIVTTNGRNNHAIRDIRWRYIRYADGSEELYDHKSDPHEWNNLAGNPEYAAIIDRLAKWIPKVNAPDAKRDENL